MKSESTMFLPVRALSLLLAEGFSLSGQRMESTSISKAVPVVVLLGSAAHLMAERMPGNSTIDLGRLLLEMPLLLTAFF